MSVAEAAITTRIIGTPAALWGVVLLSLRASPAPVLMSGDDARTMTGATGGALTTGDGDGTDGGKGGKGGSSGGIGGSGGGVCGRGDLGGNPGGGIGGGGEGASTGAAV